MLKKDNIALGIVIGLVLPALLAGLFFLLATFVHPTGTWSNLFEKNKLFILALAVNVIPIRLYFVSYKMDKTGKGVLLSTFLLMILFFAYIEYF